MRGVSVSFNNRGQWGQVQILLYSNLNNQL